MPNTKIDWKQNCQKKFLNFVLEIDIRFKQAIILRINCKLPANQNRS